MQLKSIDIQIIKFLSNKMIYNVNVKNYYKNFFYVDLTSTKILFFIQNQNSNFTRFHILIFIHKSKRIFVNLDTVFLKNHKFCVITSSTDFALTPPNKCGD